MSKGNAYKSPAALFVAAVCLAFLAACASQAKSVAINQPESGVPADEYQADEFIGTPIIGDYDDNEDLDFVLEVVDGDRRFKINVHEDVNSSNREVIDLIRTKINEMEDSKELRVIGYYNSEYRGKNKEYGFLNLKCIVFFDDQSGYEEAYFTDAKDSRFYTQGDVTVIYAPGHHYRHVYYPRYVSPWWDSDLDGIPDRYDPWPYSYDMWYDYNLNGIPDWYDPFYCSYYPYWSYWDMGFWISYDWYSPAYFRHRFNSYYYFDNYRTYTRLYDRGNVTRRDDYSLGRYRLDVKKQARERLAQQSSPRAISGAGASTAGSPYTRLSEDRRRYVPATSSSSSQDANSRYRDTGSNSNQEFVRNRAVVSSGDQTESPGHARVRLDDNQRARTVPASSDDLSRSRTADTRERTSTVPDRSVSRYRTDQSSQGDRRTYSPARTVDRSRDNQSSQPQASSGTVIKRKSQIVRGSDTGVLTSPTRSERSSSTSRERTPSSGTARSSGSYTPPQSSSRSREVVRPASPTPSSSSNARTVTRQRDSGSSYTPPSRSSSPQPRANTSSSSNSSSRSSSSSQGRSSSNDRKR